MLETGDFLNFFNNLSLIPYSSVHLTFPVFVFASPRFAYPADGSFINAEPLTRVHSVDNLGITVDYNVRWSPHISICVKINLENCHFTEKRLRHFQAR